MSTADFMKYGPLEVTVSMVGERKPQFDPDALAKGWYLYEVMVASPDDYYATVVYLRFPDEHREAAQVTIEQLYKALKWGSDWPDRSTANVPEKYARWFWQKAEEQVAVAERWGEDLLKPAAEAEARKKRRRSGPHGWSPGMGGSRLADPTVDTYTLVWLDPDGGMHRTDYTYDEMWEAETAKKEIEAEEGEGTIGIVMQISYRDFMGDE